MNCGYVSVDWFVGTLLFYCLGFLLGYLMMCGLFVCWGGYFGCFDLLVLCFGLVGFA